MGIKLEDPVYAEWPEVIILPTIRSKNHVNLFVDELTEIKH